MLNLRTACFALLAATLVLAGVALVAAARGPIAIYLLMGEPAAIAGIDPLLGAVSNLGAFLWFGTAAICLFTAALLRHHAPARQIAFVTAASLLSAALWIDDFFMVHEEIAPARFGIAQSVVLSVGALIAASHLAAFRREYASNMPLLMVLALSLIAGSAGIDLLDRVPRAGIGFWRLFLEDGLKWLGIVCWTLWHVAYCHDRLRQLQSA